MPDGTYLEHTPQAGNVPLHQIHGIPGRLLTPHGVDHVLSAHRPTRLQCQHRQDHPLLERSKIYNGLAPPDSKWTQQAESQRGNDRIIHISLPAARRDSEPT
jgi:hypothetical protein